MATYTELLKHPKWQKKRLEVLERAEFSCYECGETEKTLNVHHTITAIAEGNYRLALYGLGAVLTQLSLVV